MRHQGSKARLPGLKRVAEKAQRGLPAYSFDKGRKGWERFSDDDCYLVHQT